MAKNNKIDYPLFLRVLEHDKADQIRIGYQFISWDLDKTTEGTMEAYEKKLEWCGGSEVGFPEYYKRIALVDAESLAVVKILWKAE